MFTILVINGLNNTGTVKTIRSDRNGALVYNPEGSANIIVSNITQSNFNFKSFLFDHHNEQIISPDALKKASLFINQISDPDSHQIALSKAIRLYNITKSKTPWINNPEKIAGTRRDIIFNKINKINNLYIPKTIRTNNNTISGLKKEIKSNNIKYPLLIRPTGSHGGEDLELIESESGLKNKFCKKDVYITEYIEYKNNKNVYEKYRIAVVNGKAFIRHIIYSDKWKIHSSSRKFMENNKEFFIKEERKMHSFKKEILPRIKNQIDEIYNNIGLDYFGIDCAIREGGLIIFEVNANMNILTDNQSKPNIWEGCLTDISSEVVKLINRKINNV